MEARYCGFWILDLRTCVLPICLPKEFLIVELPSIQNPKSKSRIDGSCLCGWNFGTVAVYTLFESEKLNDEYRTSLRLDRDRN